MIKMLSISAALFLAAALNVTAGERVRPQALPSVLEVSRTIFRENDGAHQFSFRGGVVTYWPSRGSQWTAGGGTAGKGMFAEAPTSSALPNGCLVYACARAEQIRLSSGGDESQSRVITYRRADGSGHAFVLFKKGKASMAEDNGGHTTMMPAFENRSAAEALYMSQAFQKRTGVGYSAPVQASFVGKF